MSITGKNALDDTLQDTNRPGRDELEKQMSRALMQCEDSELIKKMSYLTGAIGILDTGKPGPCIAYRFDIDSVDLTESKIISHKPVKEGFASINEEFCHACGHDGHTAIGLGFAEKLMELKNILTGKYILIFQPAEEGGGGAKSIVAKGFLDKVDYFFTLHLGLGKNGVPLRSGEIAGGCNDFLDNQRYDVAFEGKAAHPCGDSHKGNNAILAACTACLNLHAIAPHGKGMTRVNVGLLSGGIGRNTIAPNAQFKFEIRGDSDETAEYMKKRAFEIIEGAAKMHDIKYKTKYAGSTPSAKSDIELVRIIEDAAKDIPFFKKFYNEANIGGSDDATEMMRRVQANGGKVTYFALGCNFTATLHHGEFDFDESVMFPGIELLLNAAKKT